MKFSFGRGKFQRRRLEIEKNDNPRLLEVLLFNSERSWAYAMDLKQGFSNQAKMKDVKIIITCVKLLEYYFTHQITGWY